jgi:hypothetical protein
MIIDAGVEGGFYRSTDVGATWGSRTDIEALATQDQCILVPNLNSSDNQDILAIFWDASADEISRVNYDDSANTWTETSISTGMVDQVANGFAFPHFAATTDLTNNQIVLIAWNGIDTANADLKCWTITESAITGKTDVVTNGTDDQGVAALGIDTNTNNWYAFYVGKSDGSETYPTATNVYMKISADSGTTWSTETAITSIPFGNRYLGTPMRFTQPWWIMVYTTRTAVSQLRNLTPLSL